MTHPHVLQRTHNGAANGCRNRVDVRVADDRLQTVQRFGDERASLAVHTNTLEKGALVVDTVDSEVVAQSMVTFANCRDPTLNSETKE